MCILFILISSSSIEHNNYLKELIKKLDREHQITLPIAREKLLNKIRILYQRNKKIISESELNSFFTNDSNSSDKIESLVQIPMKKKFTTTEPIWSNRFRVKKFRLEDFDSVNIK